MSEQVNCTNKAATATDAEFDNREVVGGQNGRGIKAVDREWDWDFGLQTESARRPGSEGRRVVKRNLLD